MSLQQQIGQTERALEGLLVEVILKSTPFRSVADWIAVTVLAGPARTASSNWIDRIAGTALIPYGDAEAIASHLITVGVASDEPAGVALSPSGHQTLHEVRARIAIVTSILETRISDEERATTERVLTSVRDIALSVADLGQLSALSSNR